MCRPNPERVKLTTEELSAVIQQTQKNIQELEEGEQEEGKENVEAKENVEGGVKVKEEDGGKKEKTEEDITAEYGLEDYDEEEEGGEAPLLGLGDLTSFANPAVSSPVLGLFPDALMLLMLLMLVLLVLL